MSGCKSPGCRGLAQAGAYCAQHALSRPTMDAVLCELQACKRQRAALQALVDAADAIRDRSAVTDFARQVAAMDVAIANARAVLRGDAS